jgi:type III secretory pathway component EscU
MTKQYIEPVFIALAVGFVAIALDAWIYEAIANMEKLRESNDEDRSKEKRETEDSPDQE